MAVQEQWIYQKRNVSDPWAIYLVRNFDKRYPRDTTTIDFTFYHDSLKTATKTKSFMDLKYNTAKGYADRIIAEIAEFVDIDASDYEQIITSIRSILIP